MLAAWECSNHRLVQERGFRDHLFKLFDQTLSLFNSLFDVHDCITDIPDTNAKEADLSKRLIRYVGDLCAERARPRADTRYGDGSMMEACLKKTRHSIMSYVKQGLSLLSLSCPYGLAPAGLQLSLSSLYYLCTQLVIRCNALCVKSS
jgi:hypothetical protein